MLPVGGAAPRTFAPGGKNPRAATGGHDSSESCNHFQSRQPIDVRRRLDFENPAQLDHGPNPWASVGVLYRCSDYLLT